MPMGNDIGKAAKLTFREDTLQSALNRNTAQQKELARVVRESVEAQLAHLDKHLEAMTRLRDLQFSDVDRQLESLAQSRKEMALGRKALNQNTVAMNEHAAAIKELVLALQSYGEGRRRG
jgi:hypothetical protein